VPLQPKKYFHGALSTAALLSFFLFPIQPVLAKKVNYTKLLSEIAHSCREIDSKIKAGTLQGSYWVEVAGDDNGSHWVSFGSKDAAEKANQKGFWKDAQVYSDGEKVVLMEMEIKTPTKEWVQKIDYYFRQDGTLGKAHSNFRTFGAYDKKKGPEHQFLAKVLRDRFYDTKGKCIKRSTPVISNASTHREMQNVVFTDGSWPFYPNVSGLPFSVAPAPAKDVKKN